ncbi:MAG: tetratricopeptide repeat protein [Deltaproteobacteria bacterium]|nr:tetratricopeptide repeat protein [Deltaproteobacteria bacterium]
MNIQNTKAWKAAEWEYGEIHAQSLVPFLDFRLSPEEIIERLEEIIEICPKFYPALLESGLRQLALVGHNQAKQRLDEGFRLMLELAKPQHLDEELDGLLGNLEDLWRFDLCRHYLEFLVERYPHNALFQDYRAHAAARMGDIDEALLYIAKAVEMEPDNPHFRSNQGWIYLIAGNLKEAGKALAETLRLDPDNEVVKGNLEIHRYLSKHGGHYFDYLLRPADKEEIDRLANEEEWEEVDKLCGSYNDCRMEAMAQALFKEDEQKRSRLPDLLSTLREFFRFVHKVDQGGYVLNEDLSFIHEFFKPIMHKFIFKFGDIDCEMIEEIYESLFDYYGFLARQGLVPTKEFKQFQKKILGMKNELMEKMQRYNMVRHNDDMDEEEKNAIREELFEGDHAWPFL